MFTVAGSFNLSLSHTKVKTLFFSYAIHRRFFSFSPAGQFSSLSSTRWQCLIPSIPVFISSTSPPTARLLPTVYDVVDDGRSTSSLGKLEMHRSQQQTAVETADEEAYRAVTDKLNKQKPQRKQQTTTTVQGDPMQARERGAEED